MKTLLIVVLLLSGCTSRYSYNQVDNEYDMRLVTTTVSDTTEPSPLLNFTGVMVVLLAVVAALGAMGGAMGDVGGE